MADEIQLSNIVAIVNAGFGDTVMETAKKLGARGGTIIEASGTVSKDAAQLYGITVNPEKEIILILIKKDLANAMLSGLYDVHGQESEAQGTFFSLPVEFASENLYQQYKKKEKEE